MCNRQIREYLEKITKHTLYIKEVYNFFYIQNVDNNKPKLLLEVTPKRIYGKIIDVADLTIYNNHGLVFMLSSNTVRSLY